MKKYFFFILLGILLGSSCTKDFDTINTNPNVAETVDPDYLFPNSVLNSITSLEDMEYEAGWTYGMYWTVSGGAFVNFGTVDIALEGWWRSLYVTSLTGLAKIVEMYGDNPDYTNRVLIANIWKSYIYSQMVSCWGPVPFTEAINEDVSQAYDSEITIYHTLINNLIAYADSLDVNGDTYLEKADLIYGNNIVKWKKFARSLALRLTMQIRTRDNDFALLALNQLLSRPEDLIASNDENANFQWYNVSGERNPLYERFIYSPGDRHLNISEILFMYMDPYSDPRLQVYAENPINGGLMSGRPINRASVPPGANIPNNPHASRSFDDYSAPGDAFFSPDWHSTIISYPEICFLRAEAAYLGLSGESARTLYYAGIDASMQMFGRESRAEAYKAVGGITWGTYGAGVTDWLGSILPQYAFSSEIKNPYKQIIIQSWLAMYPRGLDAWALFRRTGIVELPVLFAADPSNDEIPVNAPVPERFMYPSQEQTYNTIGYDQGVSELGNGDLMYSPLLFSVNRQVQ